MSKKLLHSAPKMSVFLFLFALCAITNAQIEQECGTRFSPEAESNFFEMLPELEKIEKNFQPRSLSRSGDFMNYLPIKAHVLRQDDGTGGLSQSQLNDAITEMNVIYANASIEFFICGGINYIDDTDYYNFSENDEYALTNSNNIDDTINIYFANTVSSSTGSSLCGYAYFPGGPETIIMKNTCATNGSTLSHEMGHFFALSHTHGNFGATTELVNGSNCDTNGDYICDTPADPKLSYSNVNWECSYTGDATDANEDTYVPDEENLMSYSRKTCRSSFSAQQYARINAVLQAARGNLTCPDLNVAFESSYTNDCDNSMTVSFTDNSVGATSWEWDVDADGIVDYTTQNPTHTYAQAAKYDVSLKITDSDDLTIGSMVEDFINIGVRTVSTSELTLTLNTDNRPSQTTWAVIDSDGNTLHSGGPYTEGSQDEVTITETFTVNPSDSCFSFEIYDSGNNGLSSSNIIGSYELRDGNNNLIVSGSDFESSEETFMAPETLSAESFLTKDNIALIPNPASSEISITLTDRSKLPEAYEIYSILGQNLGKREINSPSDLKINISSLKDGMYIIRLKKDNAFLAIPFLKN